MKSVRPLECAQRFQPAATVKGFQRQTRIAPRGVTCPPLLTKPQLRPVEVLMAFKVLCCGPRAPSAEGQVMA